MKAFRVEVVPEDGTEQGTYYLAKRGNWVLLPYRKWMIGFYRSEMPEIPANLSREDIEPMVKIITEMTREALEEAVTKNEAG